MTLFATVDRPDESVVARIEFVDATLLLDHRRPVEPDAGLRGDDQPGTEAGRDAHPAERSDRACHQPDHRRMSSQIQDGRADLGNRVEAEVGFLQPHATGFEQDDRGGRCARPAVRSGQQQRLGDLRAGHFTRSAAEEALLDGGHHDGAAVDGASGDDRAVICLGRDALGLQPWGFEPIEWPRENPQ